MMEQRLAQEREEEAAMREVHAQPVPDFKHAFHPQPSTKVSPDQGGGWTSSWCVAPGLTVSDGCGVALVRRS